MELQQTINLRLQEGEWYKFTMKWKVGFINRTNVKIIRKIISVDYARRLIFIEGGFDPISFKDIISAELIHPSLQ